LATFIDERCSDDVRGLIRPGHSGLDRQARCVAC
jgi:hypothetical protein